MQNAFKKIHFDEYEYKDKLYSSLKKYKDITIESDGSYSVEWVNTDYFVENDVWESNFFKNATQLSNQKLTGCKDKLHFKCNNKNINRELKYYAYYKVFSEEWKLNTLFRKNADFKRVAIFLDNNYPYLSSILKIDLNKAELKWINFLEERNIKTTTKRYMKIHDKNYIVKTQSVHLLNNIYDCLMESFDQRTEWEKDIWDIRNLKDKLEFNKTTNSHYINFTKINKKKFRKPVKKYLKMRLLNENIKFNTGVKIINSLSVFLNYISQKHNDWNSLEKLEREDIEKFIEHLNKEISKNKRIKNPKRYKINIFKSLKKFLEDLQIYEYDIAPQKSLRRIIFDSDQPKEPVIDHNDIKYIPDKVLEQLKDNMNELPNSVQLIVLIMLETGLRISDTLTLKMDCLEKLNRGYYIRNDIMKVNVKNHRVPITDELADILAVWINRIKSKSNDYNNPDNLIFVNLKGRRKGRPIDQRWISNKINLLAKENKITDVNGKIFNFNNHSFRHTYGVKMINTDGVDILVVSELMAHASPKMTMRYAKLVDDTKRKAFEKAVKDGAFTFTKNGEIVKDVGKQLKGNLLDTLWRNHKLDAIDTPYGVCTQRKNGSCTFAKEPPCLTCNNGNPCKDLLITENDKDKYELLIEHKENWVEIAQKNGRKTLAENNNYILEKLKKINTVINNGNIVYGRNNRLLK